MSVLSCTLQRRFVQLHLSLEHLRKDLDPEAIHQLRVTIKKIRAVLEVLDKVTGNGVDSEAVMNELEHLFKAAGNLRESQVCRTLFKHYAPHYLAPYMAYLDRLQRRLEKHFRKRLQLFRAEQMQGLEQEILHAAGCIDEAETLKIAEIVFSKVRRKVGLLGNRIPDEIALHKLRRHLKSLQEWLLISHEINQESSEEPFRENLRLLTSRIGRWHDQVVLRDSLTTFYQRKVDKNEDSRYWKRIFSIDLRQKQEQLKIRSLLANIFPGFINPAEEPEVSIETQNVEHRD